MFFLVKNTSLFDYLTMFFLLKTTSFYNFLNKVFLLKTTSFFNFLTIIFSIKDYVFLRCFWLVIHLKTTSFLNFLTMVFPLKTTSFSNLSLRFSVYRILSLFQWHLPFLELVIRTGSMGHTWHDDHATPDRTETKSRRENIRPSLKLSSIF